MVSSTVEGAARSRQPLDDDADAEAEAPSRSHGEEYVGTARTASAQLLPYAGDGDHSAQDLRTLPIGKTNGPSRATSALVQDTRVSDDVEETSADSSRSLEEDGTASAQLLSEGGRGTLAQAFRTLPIGNANASRAISALAHDGTTGKSLRRTALSRAAEQPAAQPVRFSSLFVVLAWHF